MKIKYTKRRLRYYLIFAVLWLLMGIISITSYPEARLNYGFFIFGMVYLSIYLYTRYHQYLSIENGIITKQSLIPKKLNLSEIQQIRKFGGDYTLKTDTEELKINTQIIDKESLIALDKILDNLNVSSTLKD